MVAGQFHSKKIIMANLTESSSWIPGIYQLEITDPVEGGELGISNMQAKQLGNRTKWLYDKIIALLKFAPKNRGYFTGLDIGGTSGALTVSGEISSAIHTSSSPDGSVVLVTVNNSMGNLNYKVIASIESNSTNVLSDCEIGSPVVRKISETQFQIGFIQFTPRAQNIKVHIDVISLD